MTAKAIPANIGGGGKFTASISSPRSLASVHGAPDDDHRNNKSKNNGDRDRHAYGLAVSQFGFCLRFRSINKTPTRMATSAKMTSHSGGSKYWTTPCPSLRFTSLPPSPGSMA